ncbi:hypothetical protein HRbin30_00511 [bacterium HR30]|nr:hypothetical protein HRbin30_00511 [bacterium HR30]
MLDTPYQPASGCGKSQASLGAQATSAEVAVADETSAVPGEQADFLYPPAHLSSFGTTIRPCTRPADSPDTSRMLWRCVVLGIALGALVEGGAWLFRLWEFRRPALRLVVILVMYGAIMGALAAYTQRARWLQGFSIAALIGLAAELWNLQFGHWWRFPDGRDDRSPARAAMVAVLALLWGIVPLAIAEGEQILRQKWMGPVPPLVRLQQREDALKQRRALLLERLEDVDLRLRDIERRRRRLMRSHSRPESGQEPMEEPKP